MWFREGGPWMYAILATDLGVGAMAGLAFLLAVGSRFAPVARWPARILAGLTLAATVLPVVEGAIGWWSGLAMMEAALEHAAEEHQEKLRAFGEAAARIPLYFGIGSTGVLTVGALVSLVIAAIPHAATED